MPVNDVPLLNDVPKDKYFRVANGTVIRSVWEFEPSLAVMGDETFRYHVNQQKNDFAAWAADVLGDDELSKALRETPGKQDMRIAVLRRLVKAFKGG